MIKRFFVIGSIFGLICSPLFVLAQTDNPGDETTPVVSVAVEPIVKSEEFVRVGKKAIFDASSSVLANDIDPNNVSYAWEFGDGSQERGVEVVHEYGSVGTYDITLTILFDRIEYRASKTIFVYNTRALLIVDADKQTEISQIVEQAQENGVALKVLSPDGPEGDYGTEDALVKALTEQKEYIRDTDLLLFYTKSLRGLQAMTTYWQGLNNTEKEIVRNKSFVVISEGAIDIASHGVYQNFQIINPDFMLLTRPESFGPVLSSQDVQEIESVLLNRGIEFRRIDEKSGKSPWYVLSRLVTYFIEKGVSANSVFLILAIPFLAFLVVFSRHVIGMSTFGVYTPVIIAVTFYILGLGFGILTFFFAVCTSYAVKYIFNKIELLYLPRLALNLSFISLSFLLLMLAMLSVGSPVPLSLAVFPMLVMSTLSEKFLAAKSEEGLRNAVIGVIETLAVVIGSYYLMQWSVFNNLIVSWPEVVVLPLLCILLLGKFSGLRISEYFRFRSLFSDHAEE